MSTSLSANWRIDACAWIDRIATRHTLDESAPDVAIESLAVESKPGIILQFGIEALGGSQLCHLPLHAASFLRRAFLEDLDHSIGQHGPTSEARSFAPGGSEASVKYSVFVVGTAFTRGGARTSQRVRG